MTVHSVLEAVLLSVVVLSCWVGCLGMIRMREPMQSIHYVSFPACVGSVALTVAVFVRTGSTQASWKTLLICFVTLGINSVVTHATARAFRTREVGRWQPQPGDDVERLHAHPESTA